MLIPRTRMSTYNQVLLLCKACSYNHPSDVDLLKHFVNGKNLKIFKSSISNIVKTLNKLKIGEKKDFCTKI